MLRMRHQSALQIVSSACGVGRFHPSSRNDKPARALPGKPVTAAGATTV